MLNRRQSLGLVAGALLAPLKPTAAAGQADAMGAGDPLRQLMRLRASLDDRVTLEWIKGVVYGVVDAVMTPLFSVNSVAFAWYRLQADGSFAGRRMEVLYHGDLETGERLERFTNPYTGASVDVPMEATGPMPAMLNSSGLVMPPRLGQLQLQAATRLGDPVQRGPRVWQRLETRVQMFAPGGSAPVSTYNETMVYSGLVVDLNDADRPCVPSQLSYFNLMSWRPWLGMAGRPGHTTTNGTGEKVEALDQVPADLRAFVEQQYPDLARDPRAALG